jgi:hypothetical protein
MQQYVDIRNCIHRFPVPTGNIDALDRQLSHLYEQFPELSSDLISSVSNTRNDLGKALDAINNTITIALAEQFERVREKSVLALQSWYKLYGALLRIRHCGTSRVISGDHLVAFEWKTSADISSINGDAESFAVVSSVLRFETAMLLWTAAIAHYNSALVLLASSSAQYQNPVIRATIRSYLAASVIFMMLVMTELSEWSTRAICFPIATKMPSELDSTVALAFKQHVLTLLMYSITMFSSRDHLYKSELRVGSDRTKDAVMFTFLIDAYRSVLIYACDTVQRVAYYRSQSRLVGFTRYMHAVIVSRIYACAASRIILLHYETDIHLAQAALRIAKVYAIASRNIAIASNLMRACEAPLFDEGYALSSYLVMMDQYIASVASALRIPIKAHMGPSSDLIGAEYSYCHAFEVLHDINLYQDVMRNSMPAIGKSDLVAKYIEIQQLRFA